MTRPEDHLNRTIRKTGRHVVDTNHAGTGPAARPRPMGSRSIHIDLTPDPRQPDPDFGSPIHIDRTPTLGNPTPGRSDLVSVLLSMKSFRPMTHYP